MSRYRILLLAGAALALAGVAASPAHAEKNRYQAQVLVSDGFVPGAPHTDSHLVNGWGIAFNPNGFVWVADNGTGVSTLYDGTGAPSPQPTPLVVTIPAAPDNTEHPKPTGIVFSGSADFVLTAGGKSGPSRFIFSTEDGLIAGWAPAVDGTHALQAYPKPGDPPSGAVYKGLALANNGSGNFLYAADFVGGKIDVFNATFAKVTLAGDFSDPSLPEDFNPFNIQNIDGHLFVTYAKHEANEDDEIAGKGLGAVNEFDANGLLLRRIATGGKLNAPWGIVLAPASFGKFANDLLVGNFGDGTINAYDAQSGKFRGQLKGTNNKVLHLDGLWGMAFGNDLFNQPKSTLFFAAGPDDENHGAYGSIVPAPKHPGDDEDDGDDSDD
jgi:uncharacterized protein (TIGR03118 family)